LLPAQALGNCLQIHSEKNGLPEIEGVALALLGVDESRNAFEQKPEKLEVDAIRMQLYKLLQGNWNFQMVDLGNVPQGERVEDTYALLKEVISDLIQLNIVPVVIGATQDLTYPIYRAFDLYNKPVNIVSVDSRFDFGVGDELISSHSYMSKIISEKPTLLHNFSNLGYQSYFIAQEERDLMEKMFFDSYRLGEIASNLSKAEPILRDAHIVSVDCRSIRASEMGGGISFSPNGFTGREICALSRYAGLSEKVNVYGVFESDNHSMSNQMVAQMIWYFLEGYTFRKYEHPYKQESNFLKYTVANELENLVFYKSVVTERWWVEISFITKKDNKSKLDALLPCTEQDYRDACENRIPERWLNTQKKGFC
jgi:arginase family enzyme